MEYYSKAQSFSQNTETNLKLGLVWGFDVPRKFPLHTFCADLATSENMNETKVAFRVFKAKRVYTLFIFPRERKYQSQRYQQ